MSPVLFLQFFLFWDVLGLPQALDIKQDDMSRDGAGKNLIPVVLKSKKKMFTKEEFRHNSRPFLDCDCGVANKRFKVVGGEETSPNKYPWLVQILRKGGTTPYCGGSLINDRYVITAAHCLRGLKPNQLILYLGAHSTTAQEKTIVKREVNKIISHTQFDPVRFNKDVALMEIDKLDLTGEHFHYIRPVCLPDPMMNYEGMEATVAGWGRLQNNGAKPAFLQETNLKIITLQSCQNDYGFEKKEITNKMLCATTPGKDACQGDSGGPLVTQTRGDRFELVGIVSWGIDCASPTYPGVYTKVDFFMDFIAEHTDNANWCRI